MILFHRLYYFFIHYPRRPNRTGLLMHLYHFWDEKMSRGGQTLVLSLLLALLVEFLPGLSWAVGFIILGFLALSYSFVYSLFRAPTITINAHPPTFALVGDVAYFEIYLHNPSQKDLKGVTAFFRRLPDGLESKQDIPYVEILEAKQSAKVTLELQTFRRGHYELDSLQILQIDPLGLINRRRTVQVHWQLDVIPKAIDSPIAPWRDKNFWSQLSSNRAHGIESQTQFKGLRHYQNGDTIKMIHHKSWARLGTPVVREFHTTQPIPEIHFIIDPSVDTFWHKPSIDLLVGYFYHIQNYLQHQNYRLHYHLIGNEITTETETHNLYTLLAQATSKVNTQSHQQSLIHKKLSEIQGATTFIFSIRAYAIELEAQQFHLQVLDELATARVDSQHYQLGAPQ